MRKRLNWFSQNKYSGLYINSIRHYGWLGYRRSSFCFCLYLENNWQYSNLNTIDTYFSVNIEPCHTIVSNIDNKQIYCLYNQKQMNVFYLIYSDGCWAVLIYSW